MKKEEAIKRFQRMKKVLSIPNSDAERTIEAIDMAIDALSVVQCKDCKHRNHCHETVAHTKEHDGFREHWSESIEWCSRGERKGGDDIDEGMAWMPLPKPYKGGDLE